MDNSSQNAVFVHELDQDGNPGVFIDVNNVGCGKLGYTKDELLNFNLEDITAGGMRKNLPMMLEKLSA